MPPVPQKPSIVSTGSGSVIVSWEIEGNVSQITHYTVLYKTADSDEQSWDNLMTNGPETKLQIDNLKSDTEYVFRVASNINERQCPPGMISDVFRKTEKDFQYRPKVSAVRLGQESSSITNTNISKARIQSMPIDGQKPTFRQQGPLRKSFEGHAPVSSQKITSFDQSGQVNTSTTKCRQTSVDQFPPVPHKPTLSGTPSLCATHDSIPLTWEIDDSKDVTGFTVYYKKASGEGRSMIFETEGAETSCIIDGLEPLTPYKFRVASNTLNGQSPQSELSDVITTSEQPQQTAFDQRPPRPHKPTLRGPVGHNFVSLAWHVFDDMTHVTHFNVAYRVVNTSTWMVHETNSAMTSCIVNDLVPSTSYQFRVTSNTQNGQSPPSEISDIIKTKEQRDTQNAPNTPPQPSKPKATAIQDCNSIKLCWTVHGNTERIKNYAIGYRKTDAKTGWMTVVTTDSNCCYTIEDLEAETSYEFRIASNTDQGQSLQSEICDAIYTACKKLSRKPCNLACCGSPNSNSLTLAWQVEGGMSDDITHFTVFCQTVDSRQSSESCDGSVMEFKTEGAQLEYTIQCLEPNTDYFAWVASDTNDGQQHFTEFSLPFKTARQAIPPPGAPILAPGQMPTQYTIPIVWQAETERFPITHFTLSYKASASDDWEEIEIPASTCEYTLKGLREGTDYTLRVKAHSQTESSASSKESSISTECRSAGQIAREKLKRKSKFLESNQDMSIYQAPLIMTKNEAAEKIQMLDLGSRSMLPKPEKIILVVGATGAGKSTLINGLLNYVIGVEWEENIRFRLVQEAASFDSQHKSQTQSIAVYTLHHQDTFSIPYTIRVIDTPGFGDTEGISKDKLITECIHNLFKNKDYGIDHIDGIGFVAQSSLARLTPTQKYIFENILSLFGKDIKDNIFLLLTFSDSQMPPVLASTREAKIPFKSYFKFNNSALFARNDTKDNDFDKLFWKMGVMSFKKFLSELENVEEKSLSLTKEVLEERQQLEVQVEGIQKSIYEGLTKLEQYKVEIDVVKQHEADIEKNKNFKYTVDEHKMVKVDLEPGKHVTNCLTCNRTCHYPCMIPNDEDKARCWAMDGSGNCRICSENCIWNLHRNVPFRIEVEEKQVTKTAEELKKRYDIAKGEKVNAEKLTNQILEDFYNLEIKVLHMVDDVKKSLERLSEIALRPNPLSAVEYLNILIKSERAEAKPGFKERIDQLERVKEQAIALNKMAQQGYDPFQQYRESLKLAKTTQNRPSLNAVAADIRKAIPSTFSNLRDKIKAGLRMKKP